jgi:hypothetical protein
MSDLMTKIIKNTYSFWIIDDLKKLKAEKLDQLDKKVDILAEIADDIVEELNVQNF